MQDNAKSLTKVLIVDDHPVVLLGSRSLFASESSIRIEEANRRQIRSSRLRPEEAGCHDHRYQLPDVSGFELMRRIRKDDPEARIIIFSMNDDPAFVVRAIEMGAQGYISRGDDPRVLVKAVRKVAAGDNFISPQLAEAVTFSAAAIKASPATQMSARELEILRLLGRGDKIVEVAKALSISYKTVATRPRCSSRSSALKAIPGLIRFAVEMDLS